MFQIGGVGHASNAIISLIVLAASTVSTCNIRVWPVCRSIAP